MTGATTAARVRAALARIELAASELARHPATPRQRELASAVREAVAELDALVPRAGPASDVDLVPVLRETVERLAPVFAARGQTLRAGPLPEHPVPADAVRARRAALALLATATRHGAPLDVALGLDAGADGYALVVRADGPDGPVQLEAPPGGDLVPVKTAGELRRASDGGLVFRPSERGAA